MNDFELSSIVTDAGTTDAGALVAGRAAGVGADDGELTMLAMAPASSGGTETGLAFAGADGRIGVGRSWASAAAAAADEPDAPRLGEETARRAGAGRGSGSGGRGLRRGSDELENVCGMIGESGSARGSNELGGRVSIMTPLKRGRREGFGASLIVGEGIDDEEDPAPGAGVAVGVGV